MKLNKIIGVAAILAAASFGFTAQAQETNNNTGITLEERTGLKSTNGDWEPIGVWPFVYRNFRIAKVQIGIFSKKENSLPCNIHVGKNALWFSQDNETLMEAVPGNIVRVTFDNGDVYMPTGIGDTFGKVIYEGELQGKIARVFLVQKVKQDLVDQAYLDHINKTQNLLQGGSSPYFASVADVAELTEPEKRPVPLENVFYYYFNGDVFEATTKNILAHIRPERKKEYRGYTRSAEVLSFSEKSMMGVWNDFFVNY